MTLMSLCSESMAMAVVLVLGTLVSQMIPTTDTQSNTWGLAQVNNRYMFMDNQAGTFEAMTVLQDGKAG